MSITDGRRLRRHNNREMVLDALAELFREGDYSPGAARIAERAGLSPRSLFRYFADMDMLNQAGIEREMERARQLMALPVGADAPLATKVEALVSCRSALYEATAPVSRAARSAAHRHATVRKQLAAERSALRKQVKSLLGPELRGNDDLLASADVICSFETWDLLRFDQKLSRQKAAATMTAALNALLGTAGGSGAATARASASGGSASRGRAKGR